MWNFEIELFLIRAVCIILIALWGWTARIMYEMVRDYLTETTEEE